MHEPIRQKSRDIHPRISAQIYLSSALNQIKAGLMKTLEIRRIGNEKTANEKFAPSIDSSTLYMNENIPCPHDESSEHYESESPMQRKSDTSTLIPDAHQCPFPVPQPSPNVGEKL